jgi:putative tributyrin esterase
MALINCDFYSEVLGISSSMSVILPQSTRTQIGMGGSIRKEKYPVLYLLHGFSDDHTIWYRRTSIERYAAELGLAIVMPAAGKSYYTDMAYGEKYFTYISEEVPKLAREFFPISEKREDNFTAGLSMGGYGAFKVAMTYPERFSAAASLSGSLDLATRVKNLSDPDAIRKFINVFGDLQSVQNSRADLFYLMDKVMHSSGLKLKLYQCCGTEDFLYNENIKFRDFMYNLMRNTSYDYIYEEEPGTHEWSYWDMKIQRVLKWLPLNTVPLH